MSRYYYGSYGLVRGYGPLCRTLEDADKSVRDDGKQQRKNGGSSDRNAVLVNRTTGLCWWADEWDGKEELREEDLIPVKTPSGGQAQYTEAAIIGYESLWGSPQELAGFG